MYANIHTHTHTHTVKGIEEVAQRAGVSTAVLHDALACKMAPKALPCNFAPGLYSSGYSSGAAHAAGRGADCWGYVAGGAGAGAGAGGSGGGEI